MEQLIKEIAAIFGAYTLFAIIAGWLIKTGLVEVLKRESDRLSLQLRQQAEASLEQLKQQGARELEATKQQLEIEKKLVTELRTEFMAEQAINRLLSTSGWEKRSFKAIKGRIAGFSDDELRRLLVRSGAVRFRSKEQKDDDSELWGLLSRNQLPGEQEEERDEQ